MGRFHFIKILKMPMHNFTSPQNTKSNSQSAPKKCIQFILNYSKSYHVIESNGTKIGVNLN